MPRAGWAAEEQCVLLLCSLTFSSGNRVRGVERKVKKVKQLLSSAVERKELCAHVSAHSLYLVLCWRRADCCP